MSTLKLIFFFSISFLFAKAQNTTQEIYIGKYKNIAVLEMKRANVPASIKLAQGLLESSAGTSELSVNANNHFGIKCGGNWSGENYSKTDDDYDEQGVLIKSCFRKYPTVIASYRDHTDFLTTRSRYSPLFELHPRDYKGWALGLSAAGYATDPNYPQKLINMIETWRLNHFDNEIVPEPIVVTPPAIIPIPTPVIFTVNDVKVIIAQEGETPQSLSKRTGIEWSKFLEFNERLTSPFIILKEDERVFLEKKKKGYDKGQIYHYAEVNQTLYDIAQFYGVQLKRLAHRNRMDEYAVPLPGEKIKLDGWRVKKSEAPRWNFPSSVNAPPPPRPTVSDTPTMPPLPVNNGYRTVVRGDTLYALARKYQTTIEKLMSLNGLNSSSLFIGQVLKLK